eukprot:TRINITY_DN5553_c0_g1_i19.p1 TRINITY_DN5553_c0_g1~~TRINITY_DN5553_c0_g1_i19.p1  ORF type:complete len:124 (-),score=0.46 TRINITY_DN5553_c0_g1_i19:125-496(-)
MPSLVGSEMCIRDRTQSTWDSTQNKRRPTRKACFILYFEACRQPLILRSMSEMAPQYKSKNTGAYRFRSQLLLHFCQKNMLIRKTEIVHKSLSFHIKHIFITLLCKFNAPPRSNVSRVFEFYS